MNAGLLAAARSRVYPVDHWCCLHIVIEDGNVSDDSVKWCLHLAKTGDDGGNPASWPPSEEESTYPHPHCMNLAEWLLTISEDERSDLYVNDWGGF